ncbi:MAG: hypothetical protein K9G30_09950 [Parvibaculum sp.]|nr:hypothetical protein [Parvibaculum sp.]
MNEHNVLRYLGETYAELCAHLEVVWRVLCSATAIDIYVAVGGLAVLCFSVIFVLGLVQRFAAVLRTIGTTKYQRRRSVSMPQ